MICMYLPTNQDEGKFEYKFILDNMKKKNDTDDRYNNNDERISKDLKKHNWLVNKFKQQLDIPDPVKTEKSSTATKKEKPTRRPKRVGDRRHSLPIAPHKPKTRDEDTKDNREDNIHSSCKIIDYSPTRNENVIKRESDYEDTKSQFIPQEVAYDLSQNKNDLEEPYIQDNEVVFEDAPYDLSLKKERITWCGNQKTDHVEIMNENISSLRKIRRINSDSQYIKKNMYTYQTADDGAQEPKLVDTTNWVQKPEYSGIRHSLPLAPQPQRTKLSTTTTKKVKTFDHATQTEKVFSEEDFDVLNIIKYYGITTERIMSLVENDNRENNLGINYISDTDSEDDAILEERILQKIQERGKWDDHLKSKALKHTHCPTFFQTDHVNNQAITKKYVNEGKKKEKSRKLKKLMNIYMNELDSESTSTKAHTALEPNLSECAQIIRPKMPSPIAVYNPRNYVLGQKDHVSIETPIRSKDYIMSKQNLPSSQTRTFVRPNHNFGEYQKNHHIPIIYHQDLKDMATIIRNSNASKIYGPYQVPQRTQVPHLPFYGNQNMSGNSYHRDPYPSREGSIRTIDYQKLMWNSQLTNYPNADWTKSK